MSDCLEVLFVSDNKGKTQSASCFDPKIGTTLMTYRGGNAPPKKCLSVIGSDYLLAAEEGKPILHVWPLNSQEPSHELKMVLPGKPSALGVSSDGFYAVAGIGGKIYVWQTSTGCLLNVISKHYQNINNIIFTHDSSHFVTSGEDGLVLVWKLADVVAKEFGSFYTSSVNQPAPVYNFSQHSLPVLDIFIGQGNLKARLFTVSLDQTCKIFCLSSGSLLLSLMFNYGLTCLTVNELETELFVGTNSGKIHSLKIDSYPRTLEHHVPDNADTLETFQAHTAAVSCLCTSVDGKTLASGADDKKVFIWDIASKQAIRCFDMQGTVTNMFFHIAYTSIFTSEFKPNVIVSKFGKISDVEDKSLEINVWVRENLTPITFENEYEIPQKKKPKHSDLDENVESLKKEILRLKEINKKLYHFALNDILGFEASNENEPRLKNGNI